MDLELTTKQAVQTDTDDGGTDTASRFRDALRAHHYPLYAGAGPDDMWTYCPGHESTGEHFPSLHVNFSINDVGESDVHTHCFGKCESTWFVDIMQNDIPECTATYHNRKGSNKWGQSVHGPNSTIGVLDIREGDEESYLKYCRQVALEDDGGLYEVGHYPYVDSDGRDYLKVKWSNKDFVWYRYDEYRQAFVRGTDKQSDKILPFGSNRIPEDCEQIWLCEGEEDVLTLERLGLVGVSYHVPGRGDNGIVSKLKFCKGKDVVVLADNDAEGRLLVEKTVNVLQKGIGKVQSLRVVPPWGVLDSKYDVSNWVADGGTRDALDNIVCGIQPLEIAVTVESEPTTTDTVKSSPIDAKNERKIIEAVERIEIQQEARRRVSAVSWTMPDEGLDFSLEDAASKQFPKRQFYIDKILAHRHIVTITGAAKTGKTTLTGNLVRTLVDGVPFLGKLEGHGLNGSGGRVGMWNCEMDAQDYTEYLLSMGIKNVKGVQTLHLRGYTMDLMSDQGFDYTVAWLNKHDIEIWIPDPWTKLIGWTGVNEDKNSEVQRVQIRIAEIQRLTGVKTVVIPTHPTKADGKESDNPSTRGAQVMEDWPDALWKYVQTQDDAKTRSLYVYGRGVDMAATALRFDASASRLTVESAIGVSPTKVADFEMMDRILAMIAEKPGIAQKDIRTAIGGATQEVTKALKHLESVGKIRSHEGTRKALSYELDGGMPDWPAGGLGRHEAANGDGGPWE